MEACNVPGRDRGVVPKASAGWGGGPGIKLDSKERSPGEKADGQGGGPVALQWAGGRGGCYGALSSPGRRGARDGRGCNPHPPAWRCSVRGGVSRRNCQSAYEFPSGESLNTEQGLAELTPLGWGACVLRGLFSGQALPEVTWRPDGILNPWIWSLLDLKDNSLTQPSALVFSRKSW